MMDDIQHPRTPLKLLPKLQASNTTPRKKVHWAVRVNHRHRSGSFAMLLVICGLQMMQQDHNPGVWLALVAQFVGYPLVAYRLAGRAADPFEAEFRLMWLDGLSLGVWLAVLHFPLWISFAILTSVVQNLTLYRGRRGCLEAVALLALGCALGGVFSGWTLQLQTDPWVTALMIIVLSVYLLSTALESHKRLMRLRDSRKDLRAKESVLQQQLSEIQSLQAKLRDQAHRDALTGLFNRRHLSDIIDRELARSARDEQPLSLLMIDIDHFKRINDTYGHQVGDDVLRETARLLNERTRASDRLFRYGGEEFLLLMSSDAESACEMAEELRQRYAASALTAGASPVKATLSIGIATFADNGCTFKGLLEAADQALYRAKRGGRNRVEVA